MKKVAFCGHRDIYGMTKEIEALLRIEVEKLIGCGADEFLLGGYGGFDHLAAKVVKSLKEKYPQIKSILVVPYLNRDYNTDLYDASEYPPIEKTPKPYAILKRNEYMVKNADAVVCYVTHNTGGAAKTLAFAERKKKTIINLADSIKKPS